MGGLSKSPMPVDARTHFHRYFPSALCCAIPGKAVPAPLRGGLIDAIRSLALGGKRQMAGGADSHILFVAF